MEVRISIQRSIVEYVMVELLFKTELFHSWTRSALCLSLGHLEV